MHSFKNVSNNLRVFEATFNHNFKRLRSISWYWHMLAAKRLHRTSSLPLQKKLMLEDSAISTASIHEYFCSKSHATKVYVACNSEKKVQGIALAMFLQGETIVWDIAIFPKNLPVQGEKPVRGAGLLLLAAIASDALKNKSKKLTAHALASAKGFYQALHFDFDAKAAIIHGVTPMHLQAHKMRLLARFARKTAEFPLRN